MIKRIGLLILTLMFSISFATMAFASDSTGGTTNTGSFTTGVVGENSKLSGDGTKYAGIDADGGIPNVTIEQAEDWAERKGFDIVGLLQTFVQPFSVIIFIICAFMTLIGAFGNSQLVGRGMFGMFIAVLMYAVVLYAPELMDFVLLWLES